MMNKDLQFATTLTTEENTIRMLFNSPTMENKILVIIEGDSDRKLFGCFFNLDNIKFHLHGSCDGMPSLLKNLNNDFIDRCIAIKDADFDNLNNVVYTELPNLFLTDAHDIEMMAFDENAENKINSEFLGNKYASCVSDVINDLQWVSYLKWFNISNHICLIVNNFANLDDIYDGFHIIELEKCCNKIDIVRANNGKCPDLFSKVTNFRKNMSTNDVKNLTNGHDVCTALSIFTKAHLGQTVGKEYIASFIRAAYNFEAFKQTKLYCKIKQWELDHKLQLFK